MISEQRLSGFLLDQVVMVLEVYYGIKFGFCIGGVLARDINTKDVFLGYFSFTFPSA